MRPVVDAGQENQRARGVERVGERQQHRHRGDGAETGEDADERPQTDPRQAVGEVRERDGLAPAECEVGPNVHGAHPREKTASRSGQKST